MKLLLFIIFTISLAGCLPEQTVPRVTGQSTQDSSVSNNTTIIPETNEDLESRIKWFNKGEFVNTMTVDLDNKQNSLLRGGVVNKFLKNDLNFKSNFCIVIDFQESTNKDIKQYRAKLIPNQFTDFKTGLNNRYFRANTISSSGNEICDIDETKKDPISETFNTIARPNDLVTDTSLVCNDCINFVTSEKVKIYKIIKRNNLSFLEEVSSLDIDTSALIFRIDMNNLTINQEATCDDSRCRSLGFDCCRLGQCVNEASLNLKGISQDSSGFQLAEIEKSTDPNWYLKYPQFYFSCLERPSTPEQDLLPPVEPTDPEGEADERLNQLIPDFQCITELKENSLSDPFHTDPINDAHNYTKCSLNSADDLFYESVMKRMYEKCGCAETQFNLMVENCPNYTYKAIFKTVNNVDTEEIENVECESPEPQIEDVPFQDLRVFLNSRSAPHRFFNEDGIELDFDRLSEDDSINTTQEGDQFFYLDEQGQKINPINNRYNMNSILGQMNLNLSSARPAKIIKVLPNTVYQIAVVSGSYTPCPECAKDSWFNNFAAHPQTSNGLGLQAVGSTTQRDNWGTNITLGNYEDTIFGRACWVPPTMLPYSHNENEDLKTQRLNRLKTQAAMFINGYQRDWFGFNKGAVIGSFNGVSWFAIGKSRLIESTSTRLYLAINAPFADLAVGSEHHINIHQWDSDSSGSFFDFDPEREDISPFQNEAGQCQSHHICESDSDCITTLGWEYHCVDTTVLKTKWPQFNPIGATEDENTSLTLPIERILGNPEPPNGPSKKCIYRGAGSPCRKDYENISGENLRKALTCAPNFYCASVDEADVFNIEVARFAAPLETLVQPNNHLFGQDADILGRPRHYVGNGSLFFLDDEIKTNLRENIKVLDSSITDANIGICRPGKLLPSTTNGTTTINVDNADQHKTFDLQNRTDYINQISGCNSALYTDDRYSSCPMLDKEGNYIHMNSDFIAGEFISTLNLFNKSLQLTKDQTRNIYTSSQNSCGLESLDTGTVVDFNKTAADYKDDSPFKFIEGNELSSGDVKFEPTLTRDACFRRAGSVCHTDLDCSPNKLMAQQIDLFPDSFFGNEAEKKYYQEYLVCGQGIEEPFLGEIPLEDFSIKNNRCCREIGKDITIYTPDTPGVEESTDLEISRFGGFNPSNPNRYSRFSSIETSIENGVAIPNVDAIDVEEGNASAIEKLFTFPSVATTDDDGDGNPEIFRIFQWQSIGKVASKTCCGGGFIRKFADGSNNWQINRLQIDPVNFKCINAMSPLLTTKDPEIFGTKTSLLNFDKSNTMCTDTSFQAGGCANLIINSNNDPGTIQKPTLRSSNTDPDVQEINTDPNPDVQGNNFQTNQFVYSLPSSFDQDPFTILNWSLEPDEARRNVNIYLPSWVTFKPGQFNNEVEVSLEDPDNGPNIQCNLRTTAVTPDPTSFYDDNECPTPSGNNDANCCYQFDEDTRNLFISYSSNGAVRTDPSITDPTINNYPYERQDLSAIISFTAAGTSAWELAHAGNDVTDVATIEDRRGSQAGDMNYYLDRLARLELVGIPQITYPPLYCNNNYQKLVPGIFKEEEATNVHEFIANANALINDDASTPWNNDSDNLGNDIDATSLNTKHVALQEMLDVSPIFSSHEFMCCKKLDGITTDASKCCSGFGVAVDNDNANSGKVRCALPAGTDLNVYFNRFVSNEGFNDQNSTSEQDSDFLNVSEFDEETGEPRQTTNVLIKLRNLGARFCENGTTVRGGAFGSFEAEINGRGPAGQTLFNIVDSNFDQATTQQGEDRGFLPFTSGLRWNHHVYCAF